MDKIRPIEKIYSSSFHCHSLNKNSKQFGQTIPCALLGSKVCPKPNECDGIHRKCALWYQHSGR